MGVMKAARSNRTLHRPAAAKAGALKAALGRLALLTVAVFSLAFLPASARAGDRVLTLAMVNYDFLIAPQFPLIHDPVPASYSFSLPAIESATESIKSFFPEHTPLAASHLEIRMEPEAVSSLWLTRTLRSQNILTLNVWNWLEPGYGSVFFDKPVAIYGRNGTAWEEPGYGYLKFSFRF
jgi:hypothetical protein